jgi:hypothetical protein
MDAAQIGPSMVNGSSRAVMPDSLCERTSSYACWCEMIAATTATATTASAVVILMSRPSQAQLLAPADDEQVIGAVVGGEAFPEDHRRDGLVPGEQAAG